MDHMRISGTEPSSVILSQTKVVQKLKSDVPKVQNQAKAKWDGVINPQNYNFSQNATNQPTSTIKLGFSLEVICPCFL